MGQLLLDDNIKKLKKTARDCRLRFAILHGSAATGKRHTESDTDVAVVPQKEMAPKKFLRLYNEMSNIFGDSPERELDLKILYRADPLFRHEVIKKG